MKRKRRLEILNPKSKGTSSERRLKYGRTLLRIVGAQQSAFYSIQNIPHLPADLADLVPLVRILDALRHTVQKTSLSLVGPHA